MMDTKWTELYNAAKAVQNDREISDKVWIKRKYNPICLL